MDNIKNNRFKYFILKLASYNAGFKDGKGTNEKLFKELINQIYLINVDMVIYQESTNVKIDGHDGYISNIMVNEKSKVYQKAKELMISYNKQIIKVVKVFYTSLLLQVVIFMHDESKSKFVIFNTHLHQKNNDKFNQYKETLKTVEKLCNALKGIPIIMCGDFNRTQNDLIKYNKYFNFGNPSNLITTVWENGMVTNMITSFFQKMKK